MPKNQINYTDDIEKIISGHEPQVRLPASLGSIWQPIVIYNRKVSVYDKPFKHHEESIPFIFYSDMVFTKMQEASDFIPIYIKTLIDKGDLPKDVVDNNLLKEDMIKAAVVKLNIGQRDYDN